LSALTNMVKDVEIRQSLVASPEIWSASIGAFTNLGEISRTEETTDLLINLIGLLHNLTFEKHQMVHENAQILAEKISKFLKAKNGSEIFLRTLGNEIPIKLKNRDFVDFFGSKFIFLPRKNLGAF